MTKRTSTVVQRLALMLFCLVVFGCDSVEDMLDEQDEQTGLSAVGCFLTSSPSSLQGSGQIFFPSGNPGIDAFYQSEGLALVNTFGVAPSGFYFLDGGSPNAYANPQALSPNGPNGTVVFGVSLLEQQLMADPSGATVVAILAHEFGHIAQFTFGGIEGPGKAPELHADYLAGWYLALRGTMSAGNLSSALQVFYQIGDYQFNSPNHHGTPDERLAAAMAGFNAYEGGTRDIGSAYQQGLFFVLGS